MDAAEIWETDSFHCMDLVQCTNKYCLQLEGGWGGGEGSYKDPLFLTQSVDKPMLVRK